jgi:hypothetical protein
LVQVSLDVSGEVVDLSTQDLTASDEERQERQARCWQKRDGFQTDTKNGDLAYEGHGN